MNKFVIILLIAFLGSCERNAILHMKNETIDMENTIMFQANIEIDRSLPIERNQVIAFKNPGSKETKVLRVIGLPGDTIEVINGEYFINREMFQKPSTSRRIYVVYNKDKNKMNALSHYSFNIYSSNYYYFSISPNDSQNIMKRHLADSIYIIPANPLDYQLTVLDLSNSKRNIYYLGPLIVPKENETIDENTVALAPMYFSKADVGEKIRQDYFFCIGDNFPESKDSRHIGLIAQSSIIGVVTNVKNNKVLAINN